MISLKTGSGSARIVAICRPFPLLSFVHEFFDPHIWCAPRLERVRESVNIVLGQQVLKLTATFLY